jgi:hypothetical protein
MALSQQPCISKTTYLMGLQCQKLLWFRYNAKNQIPAPDQAQQAVFDQGTEVGELARELFPNGLLIAPGVIELDKVLTETGKAIQYRRPLFEPAFQFNGGYARADILNPVAGNAWDIVEVKSTTGLKDVHLQDLAFQAYVFAGAGIKIRKCWLAHINSDFVRRGEIDPQRFFSLENVTKQASALSRNIEGTLDGMFRSIGLSTHPEIQIGPHCNNPYTCALHDHCWSFLPEASVFTLYRGGKKSFKLLSQGIQHLERIPDDFALTTSQEIQRSTLLAGKPHIDRPAIAAFLKQLKYPVSYLDFETIGTAIPLFDGARPFQQVPFQFSLHVARSENTRLEQHQFLAEGRADPRPEFMRRLRDALPETGSVVVYNASFERNCLKACCDLLPDFRPWFKKVERRMVDLLQPFRGFRYYHPRQNGSASMKSVLPALTGRSYENLEIQEGGEASREFLRVTFGDVSSAERMKVRKQLEEYCGLDTMGMASILERLLEL